MSAKKPNIVIFNCDQLQAFALGCYGHPLVRTPNIDRLAASGVRFANGISNAPICMPARSVLIAGQYERSCTAGAGNLGLPVSIGASYPMPEYPKGGRPHLKDETFPELLKRQGYRTCVLGKWHIWAWPDVVGFDDYVIPRTHHIHSYQHYTDNGGPEFCPSRKWSVEFEADEAEKRFKQWATTDRPFFLYYNFSPPHMPLCDAPERYLTLYDPADVPLRPNVDEEHYFPDLPFTTRVYRWDYRYYELRLPYTEDVPDGYGIRGVTAHYLGLITWIDDTLGRLMASLEENGLLANTIILFTADHGDNLGSHGCGGKGLPYEEALNVPMIYAWPGRLPAKVEPDRIASIVDIPATLLGLIDVDVPDHMHGKDLSALLQNPAAGAEEAPTERERERRRRFPWMAAGMTICEIGTGRGVLVRSEAMTALFSFADGGSGEPVTVFDNRRDPYQETNLAEDPSRTEEIEGLRAMAAVYNDRIPFAEQPDYDYRINWRQMPQEQIDAYLAGRNA